MSRGSLVIVSTISKSSSCLGAVEESNSSVTREFKQPREEKNWVAEAAKELAGRQLRAEVAQIRGCSEKK